MSTDEAPIVEEPAAAEPEQAAGDGVPKLLPGQRIKRPVRPDDTEIKAAVDVLQQSSEPRLPLFLRCHEHSLPDRALSAHITYPPVQSSRTRSGSTR